MGQQLCSSRILERLLEPAASEDPFAARHVGDLNGFALLSSFAVHCLHQKGSRLLKRRTQRFVWRCRLPALLKWPVYRRREEQGREREGKGNGLAGKGCRGNGRVRFADCPYPIVPRPGSPLAARDATSTCLKHRLSNRTVGSFSDDVRKVSAGGMQWREQIKGRGLYSEALL